MKKIKEVMKTIHNNNSGIMWQSGELIYQTILKKKIEEMLEVDLVEKRKIIEKEIENFKEEDRKKFQSLIIRKIGQEREKLTLNKNNKLMTKSI